MLVAPRRYLSAAIACLLFQGQALAQAPPQTISVVSATYGRNLWLQPSWSATQDARRVCDGLTECWYKVFTSRLGNPAYGAAKDYLISWKCGGTAVRTAYARSEAGNGSLVSLSCRDVPPGFPPAPEVFTECEGTGACGEWIFVGREGRGEWPYGAQADLTILRTDPNTIAIWRTDTGGSSPGLTAIYKASRSGSQILTDVTWSWPGHTGFPAVGHWVVRKSAPGSGIAGGRALAAGVLAAGMLALLAIGVSNNSDDPCSDDNLDAGQRSDKYHGNPIYSHGIEICGH